MKDNIVLELITHTSIEAEMCLTFRHFIIFIDNILFAFFKMCFCGVFFNGEIKCYNRFT